MNTRGEHRAEPGVRSRKPRTAVLLLALAVAATGATWGEVHYARDGQVNRGGGGSGAVSQDTVRVSNDGSGGTVADVAALRLNDVMPTTVTEPPTPTSTDSYTATRYGGSSSADCDEAFTVTAPVAATTACGGYLTADYVEQDHSVYTCVTVFLYATPAAAEQAAKALSAPAAAGAVTFQQPASGLPDASAPPSPTTSVGATGGGAQNAVTAEATEDAQPRIEAVGSAVDVVQSAAADGEPMPDQLATPTWFLAYTVGARLAWQ
ncbi:hypothetical protein [Streptacidiphilus sp. P02-A3a]|uniref:hypothetical protein n=1 Tax=Streptacidiphilus sp. P02-A3a TaxID=2704468 RepID=UPI0015F98784|nr:hypothetical protein [Streptacidiphilus sp. P02-A3a]QMU68965.1 hypothetical protein GXP74_12680 [Streptacidiphilus sp. P02-A3a]